jgi:hypothetical protein
MVESLIVIPFFATTFVLSLFLGDFYRGKLQTVQLAKQQAFTTASANCGSTFGFPNLRFEGLDPIDMAFGMAQNILMGAPWTSVFTKQFKQAVQVTNGTATAEQAFYVGGLTLRIATRTRMTCNEKPERISLLQVFLWAYAKLSPFG